MSEILDVLVSLRDRGRPHALATVVEVEGSVSAKLGAKAVIEESGKVAAGWVGGGCAESTVCHTAVQCMGDGTPRIVDLDLDDEVLGTGMPCGGSMRVYVEPILPKPRLWLLGHGRVAESLSQMAAMVGLEVIVIDDLADKKRFPDASRLIADDFDYTSLEPAADDYVVVATQHKGDHQSMKRALAQPVGYIGLIASKKRARLVIDFLRKEGFGKDVLDRVHAPAGLNLGCRLPEEIALSVMSEIVMLRRSGDGSQMRKKIEAVRSREAASADKVGVAAAALSS